MLFLLRSGAYLLAHHICGRSRKTSVEHVGGVGRELGKKVSVPATASHSRDGGGDKSTGQLPLEEIRQQPHLPVKMGDQPDALYEEASFFDKEPLARILAKLSLLRAL